MFWLHLAVGTESPQVDHLLSRVADKRLSLCDWVGDRDNWSDQTGYPGHQRAHGLWKQNCKRQQ